MTSWHTAECDFMGNIMQYLHASKQTSLSYKQRNKEILHEDTPQSSSSKGLFFLYLFMKADEQRTLSKVMYQNKLHKENKETNQHKKETKQAPLRLPFT